MNTKIIIFKSYPTNWRKEESGRKRNTIRRFEEPDVREDLLIDFIEGDRTSLEVHIKNTDTGKTFTRLVTDVTKWEGEYIISW